MSIEAAIRRDEQKQKREIAQAWHTANLVRAKRLPSLSRLLAAAPARPLHGEELQKRRQEFREMKAHLDLSKLNEWMKAKARGGTR